MNVASYLPWRDLRWSKPVRGCVFGCAGVVVAPILIASPVALRVGFVAFARLIIVAPYVWFGPQEVPTVILALPFLLWLMGAIWANYRAMRVVLYLATVWLLHGGVLACGLAWSASGYSLYSGL